MNLQPLGVRGLLGRERIEATRSVRSSGCLQVSRTPDEPSIRHMIEDPQFVLFYHAPALVVVLAKSSGTQAAEDCCLAAENLMLAARNEGLGSCWIGFARPWLDLPATKAELKLPEHYHVVAPIVLGHPGVAGVPRTEPRGKPLAAMRSVVSGRAVRREGMIKDN